MDDQKGLEEIDSHYFVYSDFSYFEKNKKKLNLLSRLIHPLSVVTGFTDHERQKLFGNTQHDLFIYREYKNKIIELDVN